MLASERVLGPRWSLKELRTFYILLKAYGKQWERLEERLPSRTNAMIRALFDMHRGYLSLPEASVEGFCTIMTDHYKSLDELQMEQKQCAGGVAPSVLAETPTTAMEIDSALHAISPMPPTLPPQSMALGVDTPPSGRGREEASLSDTRIKKKRKLERLLARDEPLREDPAKPEYSAPKEAAEPANRRVRAKRVARQVASPTLLSNAGELCARKYQLPWFYWFYSFVDVDFFAHNEFAECLHRMQLGNLEKAARPIWSSVRSSMGRPRRLSPRFLAEEKQKLEHYREVKRRADTTPSSRWPYRAPVTLAGGLQVLAQLSHPPRFATGTIENFSALDGVCKVRLDKNGSRVCSLDSVMILPDDSTATNGRGVVKDGLSNPNASSLVLLEHAYEDKLAAIALVRDLLKRKELLVNAMAKMNVQARILRYDFSTNNCVASNTISDETLFQRQYAWLVVNLDVTNRYLRAALLRLQDVHRGPKVTTTDSAIGSGGFNVSTFASTSTSSVSLGPFHESQAMLTLDHMRWAVNFLTLSRKKTSELVAELATSEVQPRVAQTAETASDEHGSVEMPSETKELVANCLSLASVVRRGSAANIPPLITQKLMERMFELLTPRFESNMDLYAELRSAAEGVALMQRQVQFSPT